jgi:hypothetical protein
MKFKYYIVLMSVFLMSSCSKDLELSGGAPEFDVSTQAASYKVGEEIEFQLKGNPGIISFYSGEVSNDYKYKEGRVLTPGNISLSFTSSVSLGAQQNQFTVLASSNFNGKYHIDDIKAATWTDITNRFSLATSATYISSGVKGINDLVVEGKPLYIVFKYIMDPLKVGAGRTWGVRAFSMVSETEIGPVSLADQVTGWSLHYFGPKEEVGRSSIAATTITLRANANPPAVYTEDWCISKPINVGKIDLGPDRPIPVKGNSDAKLDNYTYTYTKPGVYKVYFVASNTNIEESKKVIKEMEITITP